MTLKIKLVIITLILFIAGCTEKDEFTHPVKVSLKIGFFSGGFPYEGFLEFTEGQIGIQRIQFEGKREAGGDVFFETDPKINLAMLEFGGTPTIISVFDIPQGIYNYMKWDFNLKKIATEGLIDDDETDSLNIGLVIKGGCEAWYWDPPYSFSFILTIDDSELFGVRSCDVYNNSSIVLSENKDYEATLWLDLPKAFSSISLETFLEAEMSGDSEHPVVIISRSKNEDLYRIILNRIFIYAKVIVK